MIKNCLRLKDLTIPEITKILEMAEECKDGGFSNVLQDKIIANLFFEPSTRTHYSFEVAEKRLGMKVIDFDPASSSLQKGESFYDTVKTFESLGIDAVVIRDREDEYYNKLLGKIAIPIINAGDGVKDHPSQSLLDLLTIKQEFKQFSGLKVAIIGDIKHSRVAHSNIDVMKRLGMDCYISGPKEYEDAAYRFIDFETAIKTMDVIMLLRIQHERHQIESLLSIEKYHDDYGLTLKRVALMKENAIILHPAPFNRNVEIADDVVECSKSRIFKQMNNGVYVRMALLLRSLLPSYEQNV
ncbi:MAG: aspartate carbamoyltransferase catalytic subunit [Erysipelotrichaceae bacterium]|nr:aspartate carbamoyltransferase catalytic subunit [Erysipelotrichaceae bacterium]